MARSRPIKSWSYTLLEGLGYPTSAIRVFAFLRYTQVTRDAALDNTIIAHEFTHGITTRMIGGGRGNCLGTLEARGMGEGQLRSTPVVRSPFELMPPFRLV